MVNPLNGGVNAAAYQRTQGAQNNGASVGNGAQAPSVGDKLSALAGRIGTAVGNAFQRLGSEASSLISRAKEHISEARAESRRTAQNERLDQADAAVVKQGRTLPPSSFEKVDTANWFAPDTNRPVTKENVSFIVSGLMKEVKTAAKESKAELGTQQQTMIEGFVRGAGALTLTKTDTAQLSGFAQEFRNEGRTEKADFLDALVATIAKGRTADGAEELFGKSARAEMHNTGPTETFLRSTGNEGVAAVKKLMNANGIGGYAAELKSNIVKLGEQPDVQKLSQDLEDAGVTNMTSPMSKELADRVAALAAVLTDVVVSTPLPQGSKDVLADLATEIAGRGDGNESKLLHTLFSDQTVLKGVGPIATSPDVGGALKVALQFFQTAANGVTDATKFKGDARTTYSETYQPIVAKIEQFYVSSGMPTSARLA